MAKKVKKVGFAAISKEDRLKVAAKGGKASAAAKKKALAPVEKVAKKTTKK